MSDEFIDESVLKKARQKINNVVPFQNHELDIKKGTDLKPAIQPWLWPGIIPLNTFTLFAGEGGIGKSQLLLEIAARVTTGEAFMAGGIQHQLPQGDVILLLGEDDFDYQIAPKLIAANADLSKITIIRDCVGQTNKEIQIFELDVMFSKLEKLIESLPETKLVIIDPVVYFMGRIKDYIGIEVINFLGRLNSLCKRKNIAMILNKHLRKKASGSNIATATDEVGGAGAWVNSPRQSWLICRDQEVQDKVLFINLKVNIAKKQNKAYAYKVVPVTIYNEENASIQTTKLEWYQEMVEITADQAVNKDTFDRSKKEQAIEFILNYLKEYGQTRLDSIRDEALKKGFKINTFRNASEDFEKDYDYCLKITRGLKNAKIYQLIDE